MSGLSPAPTGPAAWENEIRAREEEARVAFLTVDLSALDKLWADRYAVNSPLQQVLEKERLLELLRSGRTNPALPRTRLRSPLNFNGKADN